jgi:Arc/MetJ family transcription regulator
MEPVYRAARTQPKSVHDWAERYTSLQTNIVIDDQVLEETLRVTGVKTKREAVEERLRTSLRPRRQTEIRQLRGTVS